MNLTIVIDHVTNIPPFRELFISFSEFSFTLWKSKFGFAGQSPIPADGVTKLFSDLHVGTYMLEEQCYRTTGLYSSSVHGWNKGELQDAQMVGIKLSCKILRGEPAPQTR